MNKIMIIAGGEWQKPIAKKVKDMGYYLIVSNLYENSPAFVYADKSYVADVLDKERNLCIAQDCKPDAIITDQSDIAVPTVAYICEQLGLNGIGTKSAKLFTNKYLMRDFCDKAGFPSIRYRLCDEMNEAIDFYNQYGKSIIKPLDSQSSRGVCIINSSEDIVKEFENTRMYSNSEGKVLIEEYIEGTEFTVDGIKTQNDYQVLAISEKAHYAHNHNIAKSLWFSYNNDKFDYDKLRKLNRDMVMKMNLPFGITHAEYKYMDGEFYLIEIAARGGGTRISSDIVPIMSGVDHNELLINMALGKEVSVNPKFNEKCCAILKFMEFKAGKVKKIHGLDKVKNIQGVVDVVLDFKEGDDIAPPSDDRSRPGFYIAFADDSDKLKELCKDIETNLGVEYYEY